MFENILDFRLYVCFRKSILQQPVVLRPKYVFKRFSKKRTEKTLNDKKRTTNFHKDITKCAHKLHKNDHKFRKKKRWPRTDPKTLIFLISKSYNFVVAPFEFQLMDSIWLRFLDYIFSLDTSKKRRVVFITPTYSLEMQTSVNRVSEKGKRQFLFSMKTEPTRTETERRSETIHINSEI